MKLSPYPHPSGGVPPVPRIHFVFGRQEQGDKRGNVMRNPERGDSDGVEGGNAGARGAK